MTYAERQEKLQSFILAKKQQVVKQQVVKKPESKVRNNEDVDYKKLYEQKCNEVKMLNYFINQTNYEAASNTVKLDGVMRQIEALKVLCENFEMYKDNSRRNTSKMVARIDQVVDAVYHPNIEKINKLKSFYQSRIGQMVSPQDS